MRRRGIVITLITCLVLAMSSMTALAAGTSSVAVSTSSPKVGDTFTVTVSATESGKMAVKYNKDVLSVTNCNVSGYSSSAGEVDFSGSKGTITFKANAAGQSSIAVSSDKASGSSTIVNVTGTQTTAPTEDFELNGVKYTISEKFAESEIPAGYSQTQLTINGKTYKGVTNGSTSLVYLKPVDNVAGAGKFYMYDAATNSIKDNFYLGKADYYVIPQEAEELLNDQLKSGTINVDGRDVPVYTLDGVDGFVFVYGVGNDGIANWYQYDTNDKTVQKVNEAIFNLNNKVEEVKQESLLDKIKAINIRYIIAGLIFVVIVVAVIVINIILKKRDDKEDLIDGDDEDVAYDDKAYAKQMAKEKKLAAKEEKRAAKEAKKEERRRRKAEKYIDDDDDIDDVDDELYDEYSDFDIEKRIDNMVVSDDTSDEDEYDEDEYDEESDITIRNEEDEEVITIANDESDSSEDGEGLGEDMHNVAEEETVEDREAKLDSMLQDVQTKQENPQDENTQSESKQSESDQSELVDSSDESQEETIVGSHKRPSFLDNFRNLEEEKPVEDTEEELEDYSEEDDDSMAFWEDEREHKREMKRRKKAEKKEKKKSKNIFGDDELDLTKEIPTKTGDTIPVNNGNSGGAGGSDIIDLNDL